MQTLILDTIHGGLVIAAHLEELGHTVDTVDVYRDGGSISPFDAQNGIIHAAYDLLIYPVHLRMDHPLLQTAQEHDIPTKTHHEAVAEILSEWERNKTFTRPRHIVEITGARGKTTTAHALASCLSLSGPGLLHSSAGIYRYPGGEKIGRLSITPASVLTVVDKYLEDGMTWMICEESVGVSGYHDCAILTSDEDYRCGAETRSALDSKKASLLGSPCVVIPGKETLYDISQGIPCDSIVQVDGELAKYRYGALEGICTNPLFFLSQYRTSLALATTASVLLGVAPQGINSFQPVAGRLSLKAQKDDISNVRVILDDANSGTTHITAIEAARYLRGTTHASDIILCIGQDAHAVCENLTATSIIEAISTIKPVYTILIPSGLSEPEQKEISAYLDRSHYQYQNAPSLDVAQEMLRESSLPPEIPALFAVKTWR
jgi:hypothetical protein